MVIGCVFIKELGMVKRFVLTIVGMFSLWTCIDAMHYTRAILSGSKRLLAGYQLQQARCKAMVRRALVYMIKHDSSSGINIS